MKEKAFKDGIVKYEAFEAETPPAISLSDWDDGFLAFSKGELRLNDVKGRNHDLKGLLLTRNPIPEQEGYLMEANLWRGGDRFYEELSIEQDYGVFIIQKWLLIPEPAEGVDGMRCFYRWAETMPRSLTIKQGLFSENELRTIEVVVPERRLHFFITANREVSHGQETQS
jgi:hypothetical protein